MNQWPVVFLSLKNVDGIHFSDVTNSWSMKFPFFISSMITF